MQYDEILHHLGEFGLYQKRNYFLLCIPAIFTAMHLLGWTFIGYLPAHRCRLPIDNGTYKLPAELWNVSIPWDDRKGNYSSCKMYEYNPNNTYFPWTNTTVDCNAWVYDDTDYRTSVVMKWNLVCDLSWLRALAQSCYMIGILFGDIFLGTISDRWGRRKVFILSVLLMMLSGIVIAFAPEPITFCLLRVINGVFESGVFICGFVLGVEMVGTTYRLCAGIIIEFFFAFGYFVNALLGYLLHDWVHFQLAISVPMVVFIIYLWIIPESPRWLIAQGRIEEAKKILLKAAAVNKVDISPFLQNDLKSVKDIDVVAEKPSPTQNNVSILDLFRTSRIRKISLNMFYQWFVNSLVYYGLSLNTSNLGGNDYLNFAISGAVEIPAYAFVWLVLNRLGRKGPLIGCQVLAGISLLLTLAIPKDMLGPIIFLTMLGKMAIAASFAILFIYAAELFPTVIRNIGVAISSLFGRAGGVVASYVILLGDYYPPLPTMVYGIAAIIAGILSFLFPETKNIRLADTVTEIEQLQDSLSNSRMYPDHLNIN